MVSQRYKRVVCKKNVSAHAMQYKDTVYFCNIVSFGDNISGLL